MSRLLLLPALLLCIAADATAQSESRFRGGLRAGVVAMQNEAFEELYDATLPLVGADFSVALGARWSVRGTADFGQTSGDLFIPDPDAEPAGETEFTSTVAHLSVFRSLSRSDRWSVRGGIGPTFINWKETTEFGETSDSAVGGHLAAEFLYRIGSWELGPVLSYWLVPDALPESGLAAARESRDLGGPQLTVGAGWRF